jgi:hypothetical protein
LTAPPDRQDFAFLPDPIRSRAFFLSRLTQREQIRTVEVWLRASRDLLRELADQPEESCFENDVKDVAQSNLHYLAIARHTWLQMVRRRFATTSKQCRLTNELAGSTGDQYKRSFEL